LGSSTSTLSLIGSGEDVFALSVTLLAVLLELSDAMTATEKELIKITSTKKQLNTFVIGTFFAIFLPPFPPRFYLSLKQPNN
jgi:hypothetical protein